MNLPRSQYNFLCGPQWESSIFSLNNSISFCFFSAVGASVGAVPHSGGWALLQWTRVWTLSRDPQWHPKLTGIRWQHQAGLRQMGHAGADPQPLTVLQRGGSHCIAKYFLVFYRMLWYSFTPFRCKCLLMPKCCTGVKTHSARQCRRIY